MVASVPELPPNPSLITRIRVGYRSLRVAMHEPGNPEAGARINDCFELETYARLAGELRETASGRRLLDERPSLDADALDLDVLRALPEGTLGHAFARLYDLDGVEPFETRQPVDDDVGYLSKRYRETHDLYHLVTGYHTDLAGEMELQAFVRGNLGIKSALMIVPFGCAVGAMGMSYMQGAATPGDFRLTDMWPRLRRAHRRGATSRPLLGVWFEDLFDQPLDSVREQLFGDPPDSSSIQG